MDFSQLKVLAIDDEESICDVLSSYMEFKGIYFKTANNLKEALAIFKEEDFNLIFLDYLLPDGTGFDALKKGFFKKSNLFLVLMTGHFKREMIRDTIKLGVHDFLLKPFQLKDVDNIFFKANDFLKSFYGFKEAVQHIKKSEIIIEMENNPLLIKGVIKLIGRNVIDAGFFEDETHIQLALTEALVNAIYHGNLEMDSSLKLNSFEKFDEEANKRMHISPFKDRKVFIKSCFDTEKFKVIIKDEGKGFDWKNNLIKQQHAFEPFGRGIFLIESIFDKIKWNEKGNEITLIKFKDSN